MLNGKHFLCIHLSFCALLWVVVFRIFGFRSFLYAELARTVFAVLVSFLSVCWIGKKSLQFYFVLCFAASWCPVLSCRLNPYPGASLCAGTATWTESLPIRPRCCNLQTVNYLSQLLFRLISCLFLWPSHCVHLFQAAWPFCRHTDTSYSPIKSNTFGQLFFSKCAPKQWNSLHSDI